MYGGALVGWQAMRTTDPRAFPTAQGQPQGPGPNRVSPATMRKDGQGGHDARPQALPKRPRGHVHHCPSQRAPTSESGTACHWSAAGAGHSPLLYASRGFRDAPAPGQPTCLPCSGWQDPSYREVPGLRTHRPAPPPAPTEPLQSFRIKRTPACCLTRWRGGYRREPATSPQQNPQSEHT